MILLKKILEGGRARVGQMRSDANRPGSFLSYLTSLAVLAFFLSFLPQGCNMAATPLNIVSYSSIQA